MMALRLIVLPFPDQIYQPRLQVYGHQKNAKFFIDDFGGKETVDILLYSLFE